MAYLVLTTNGQEIDRHELRGTVMVGRAADCEISVHDILLSRHHCRIEPAGGAWRVVDLKSKNGTRLGWERIDRHVLVEGDVLRVGRTVVRFYSGVFESPSAGTIKPKVVRPADPFEALSGTVAGFVYDDASVERDDEPSSPDLEALARTKQDGPVVSSASSVVRPGAALLEPATLTATRGKTLPVPIPRTVADAQARRAAYLARMEDVSLQLSPALNQPVVSAGSAACAVPATDWKLVAMLLGACVVTLAVAFVLKP